MKRDKVVFDLIEKEKQRQEHGIELIASENFVSRFIVLNFIWNGDGQFVLGIWL